MDGVVVVDPVWHLYEFVSVQLRFGLKRQRNMASSSWLLHLLLVQMAMQFAVGLVIPVNKTTERTQLPRIRVADILRGSVENTAAEEFDENESDEIVVKPSSEAIVNATLKEMLMLAPDVLETLEGYMGLSEEEREIDTNESEEDSHTIEDKYVVRLARALQHFKFCSQIPETVVLNSVEVVEHTHGHLASATSDLCNKGRFAIKKIKEAIANHVQQEQSTPTVIRVPTTTPRNLDQHFHQIAQPSDQEGFIFQLPMPMTRKLPDNQRYVRITKHKRRRKPAQ